jgi:CYTH domain-containing protein
MMAKEIERKFIVKNEVWENFKKPVPSFILQGYLLITDETTIRVRYTETKGTMTIKGKQQGISRDEYEYEIPFDEAKEIFENHCPKTLSKNRYKIPLGSVVWEVDEYINNLSGLIIAEVELASEHQQIEPLPEWIDEEVTMDIKFSNAFLAHSI